MPNIVPAAENLGSYQQYVNHSNSLDNLNWIRQAFMLNTVNSTDISASDMDVRVATTAAWKYTDTTLGGHYAINMPPQYTEYADVTMGGDASQLDGSDPDRPVSSKRTTMTTSNGYGMGRYYSEAIDDNSQFITMSFGVQAFNSLTSFFGNFYDPRASQIVRQGRSSTGFFFKLGSITGTLLSIPFIPLIMGSTLVRSLMDIPSTKFCYFKPTMPLYFNAVNTIINAITANIGIHARQLTQTQAMMYLDPNQAVLDKQTAGQVTGPSAIDSSLASEIKALHKFLPDVYSEGGGIDIYAVASRVQRLADAQRKRIQTIMDSATDLKSLRKRMRSEAVSGNLTPSDDGKNQRTLDALLKAYLSTTGGKGSDDPAKSPSSENMGFDATPDGTAPVPVVSNADMTAAPTAGVTTGDGSTPAPEPVPPPELKASDFKEGGAAGQGAFGSWWSSFWDNIKADIHDGSQYVTFRVDYAGTIGESFSNSMRSSDLEETINSMSSRARNARFDTADLNVIGGALGSVLNSVFGAAKNVVDGVLNGLQISGVAALAGSAFIDIPKMYDSSSMSLPSQSFTIELKSWSGHRLSLLQNIYVPLAFLLASVLPRTTGPQSYNGPFSCQLFSRGRMQVKNGLVTDLSITRGTDNIGWSEGFLPLGVEVSFTVTDFSSIIHMPLLAQSGFIDKALALAGRGVDAVSGTNVGTNAAALITMGSYTDESAFGDYMAILGGLSWQDQTYATRKFSIYRSRMSLNFDAFKSPSHVAGWIAGSPTGRLVSALVHGTDRP